MKARPFLKADAAYLAAATLACLAWTVMAGRDVSRDVLDYHLYAAYHFFGSRLGQDFLGAGAQTYLNPVGGLPFYLMVRAGWSSLAIGSVLAALHSLSLWVVYGMARILLPATVPARRVALCGALALAFLSPAFLFEVGTSFIDVVAALPVLAGVLLLLRAADGSPRRDLLAGACLGIAVGLKLTNAIYPFAACVLIGLPWTGWRAFIRRGLTVAAGCVAGFLVIEGAWAFALYREFGNPLFPMLNDWFPSPDFPGAGGLASRFQPGGWRDLLDLPLRLAVPPGRVFSEIPAPDLRLALLLLVLLWLGALRLWKGRASAPASSPAFQGLLVFFVVSFALWLATSANGRYAIPLWLLMGPLLVAGLVRLSASARMVVYGLGFAVLLQATQMFLLPQKRLGAADWTAEWFDVRAPQALRQEPWLFLSLDIQTGAFLFPFLDGRSAFVNVVGQNSLALDRPGGARLARLLGRYEGRTRSLMPIVLRSDETPAATREDSITRQDALLRRLKLAVDRSDCQMLGLANPAPSPQPPLFLSCRLQPAVPPSADVERRLATVERAFDAVERQCPALFGSHSPVTDDFGKAAYRRYGRDDMLLLESLGKVWLLWGWRQDGAEKLGLVDDVAAGRVKIDCASRRVVSGPAS